MVYQKKHYKWKCKERSRLGGDTCMYKENKEHKKCSRCDKIEEHIYLSVSGFIIDSSKVLCWKCHDEICDSMFEAHMRILHPKDSKWRSV